MLSGSEEENDVVLLGQLTSTQWSVILAHNAQGRLLEVARSGDWQEVIAFLAAIGAEYGPAPPPSATITRKASTGSPG